MCMVTHGDPLVSSDGQGKSVMKLSLDKATALHRVEGLNQLRLGTILTYSSLLLPRGWRGKRCRWPISTGQRIVRSRVIYPATHPPAHEFSVAERTKSPVALLKGPLRGGGLNKVG
jgi:hypothetical protein